MVEIKDTIARKSKFDGQLMVNLKKFKTRDLNAKVTRIQGPNLVENKGEIEENWKLNCQLRINLHKSKTKDYDGKGTEIRGYS